MTVRDSVRLLTALVLVFPCAARADWQLPDLMRQMSQQQGGQATFVEKKYIGLLDKPVESSGELLFTAPGRLEKRTLKPKPESLVLDGDLLVVDRPGRHIAVSLSSHPEVAAFVASIRGTLAGDRTALEKAYKLELTGSEEKWQLVLVPVEKSMKELISRIRISGARAEVKTIEFEQSDGDRSIMIISKKSNP